jgi:hypothetical protein
MKRLLVMRSCYRSQLTKASASLQLSKYENQQLAPISQLPTERSVWSANFRVLGHDAFKFSFWQNVSYLTKNISSCVHEKAKLGGTPKIAISKVRQGISDLNIA